MRRPWEAIGFIFAIGWYISGLVGVQTFSNKGYSLTVGAYLWGAMLGPIQLLLANAAPDRNRPVPAAHAPVKPSRNVEPFLGAIEASKRTVMREIDSFLQFLRAQMPNSADEVGRQLACYYLGSTEVLRRAVLGEGVLASKSEVLARLDIYQIHDILAALHSTDVVIKAVSLSSSRNYAIVYLDGVSSMYHKPQPYIEKWLDFMAQNPDGKAEHFAARVMGRQFDEIAPVLGEEPNNVFESMLWASACVEIAGFTRSVYDSLTAEKQRTQTECVPQRQ